MSGVPWSVIVTPDDYIHRLKLGNERDKALAELANAIIADDGVLAALDKFRTASRSYASEINHLAGYDCRKGVNQVDWRRR